jgi:cytochrome P450
MDGLVYLDAAVQEAMRLKPVGPFLPLEAVVDAQVEGVHVPQGSLVWCVMRHDSVHEPHFSEPGRFNPERWLDAAINKQISTPFGSGPRTCPGRYLALLEIKIATAMLLSSFALQSVSAPDGNEARELMGFVMSPVGLRMQLKAIEPRT